MDVLVRAGACDHLIDSRFKNKRHFWLSAVNERPKTKKKFKENIEKNLSEPDFTEEQKIENIVSLTGIFPFDLVLDKKVLNRLNENMVPPISDFDTDLGLCWFITRGITKKKTRNGKDFWILSVIDDTSQTSEIKCWNVKDTQEPHLNRPYIAKLQYDEQWGFSTRSVRYGFKLIG